MANACIIQVYISNLSLSLFHFCVLTFLSWFLFWESVCVFGFNIVLCYNVEAARTHVNTNQIELRSKNSFKEWVKLCIIEIDQKQTKLNAFCMDFFQREIEEKNNKQSCRTTISHVQPIELLYVCLMNRMRFICCFNSSALNSRLNSKYCLVVKIILPTSKQYATVLQLTINKLNARDNVITNK